MKPNTPNIPDRTALRAPNTCALAIALDVPTPQQAEAMIERLSDVPVYWKVGLELFLAAGPEWVRALTQAGQRIFLDLKLHDIPNTVAQALRRIDDLGVHQTTIHLMGGAQMAEGARPFLGTRLRVLGVTILTSHGAQDWAQWLRTWNPVAVSQPAENAVQTSFDAVAAWSRQLPIGGLVCSPQELGRLRNIWPDAYTVVPGIRLAGDAKNDQARTATPLEAKQAGASMIVVGRPITQSTNPKEVALRILEDLQ